jgi:hypothetical protein
MVGDFNGDGKLDIVTTNTTDNSLSLLMGNGDGTFQSPQTLHVGTDPTGVAVGDFNGNGKLDIATINSNDNSVSVLMGKSDSATSSRQSPLGNNGTENAQPRQSPLGNNGTENTQPPQPPLGNNGDTMIIGISGPLSANVSWGSSTNSTGTATSHSMIWECVSDIHRC